MYLQKYSVIIEDTPPHLSSYYVGVLNGLGIEYDIKKGSKLYKDVKEYRREKYMEADKSGDKLPMEIGYYISGSNPDVKVSMTPVWTTQ